MPTKSKSSKFQKKTDRSYKEIRRQLSKRAKVKASEDIIQETYVDQYRMMSVKMGSGGEDLKSIITRTGGKQRETADLAPGDPSMVMYLKQAKHHMKKGLFSEALFNIGLAAEFDYESPMVLSTAGRCHLMMGNWEEALKSAEVVLGKEPKNTKAIIVKAEALFNLCQFEHALVVFHRGLALSPDSDAFRLGIQKCRKTIQDGVNDGAVFTIDGVESVFQLIRKSCDLRDRALTHVGLADQNQPVSMAGLMGLMAGTKKFSEKIRGKLTWKKKAEATDSDSSDSDREAEPKAKLKFETKKKKKKSERQVDPAYMNSGKTLKANDRLAYDKIYLSLLSARLGRRTDVATDTVHKEVKRTASETLEFLKNREEFWEQLDLRNEGKQINFFESYRFIM